MKVYKVDLVLHDYLFFATTERGRIAETGAFIHNYALAYALTFNNLPWQGQRNSPPYRHEKQEQHYRDELGAMEMYVTPAKMISGSFALTQYNTQWEGYMAVTAQSAGYPNWGFIKSPRPGSTYRFYVTSESEIPSLPTYIRLGKFMSKAKLTIDRAVKVDRVNGNNLDTELLLNWNDLEEKPTLFDVIASALPTRLIYNAVFSRVAGARAVFSDGTEVMLPLGMGYLRS